MQNLSIKMMVDFPFFPFYNKAIKELKGTDSMKRFLALLLTVTLLCGVCLMPSHAEAKPQYEKIDTEYPFVLVRGMDFGGLLVAPGTENAVPVVGKPELKLTLKSVANALFRGLLRRDWDRFADEAIAIVDSMMGKMMLTKDGQPQFDTGVEQFTQSLAHYPAYTESLGNGVEEGLMKRAVETYGADKVYYYNYDWRIDPYVHAERLNALIETAKKDHNCSKVNLACCSMGGILTVSYLYKYGADSLHRVLFISSTFCGTYVTGDLLNGKVKVHGDLLYDFFITRMNPGKGAAFLLKVANKLGLFKAVAKLANDVLVPKIKDHVYDAYMRDMFGTMPVVWALTQPEDLDSALTYIFAGHEEEYQTVIDLAKSYKEMNLQRDDMLRRMQKNGLEIIVTASYELPVVPVYESGNMQGDTVLESPLMLGGATMSLLGETLPDDYQPGDSRYYSPDHEADLSTAVFPATTWALKGVPHVFTSYGTDCQDFIMWLLNEKTCPTVFTSEQYPQFMLSNFDLDLEPLK